MAFRKTMFGGITLPALLAPALLLAMPAARTAVLSPAQLTGELHWRSVGPFVGGRVIAVSGVAQQPNLYYMGAVGGGVWKSDNYGHTWENISDKYFDNNNIGAIAVAPSDPKVIYAGTGESDIRNTFLTGDGMYKSTDAGKTWNRIGLADTHVISRIVVDPKNADIVYVAALGHVWSSNSERGVYKSTDGGKTWKKILYVNDQTGAIDLTMDPANPQILYAAMWEAYRRPWTLSSGGPGSGIYKSTDSGKTWTNITHSAGLPTGIFGRVGLAIAPSNPDVLYAIIQAQYQGEAGGLFRSDDAGRHWALVNHAMSLTQRAFYYSTVFVDPKDPNTLYAPQVAALWVSHDGGKTFSKLHTPHGDNHALWINPANPQIMIEGNDGGATVTQDGGKTWSQEHNQPTGQFYHVNLDNQFPFHIYGAQQDEGSSAGPSAVPDGGIPTDAWQDVRGGESSWVVPQPDAPWITYASGYYAVMFRDDRRAGIVQSITPAPIYYDGAAADKLQYRFGWIHHPILFVPGNPQELLNGAQYVLRSLDYGVTWTVISPDLTRDDKSTQGRPGGPISADVSGAEVFPTITAMAVSPINDSIIWTGSGDGLVYLTTDNGEHWTPVRPPSLPAWSTVTCIEASHRDPGTAYLTASRYQWDDFKPYAYKTTDYGKHWTALTSGLPDDQYLESVRQDPNDPSLMFLGTSKTVFVSFDSGSHWASLALNLPAVRISDIAIQPDQHAVVLATHGRAFWVLDNLQFLEQLGKAQVASDQAYLFAPQQTWLVKRSLGEFTRPDEGENLAPGAAVFFNLPADYDGHSPLTLSFTAADGTLIRSFALPLVNKGTNKSQPLHPGMNRFQWNLRYPDATEVTGFHPPFVDDGYDDQLTGPDVLPGTYFAVLDYRGTVSKQPFEVRLDPRLTTTPQQLQARFKLLMQIRDTLDSLDGKLNQAIAARSALQKAVTDAKVSTRRARTALAALDRDIGDLVQLKIKSSEGDLVYEPMLRSHLALLANDIEINYMPLTQVQKQGYAILSGRARTGEARLQSDINQAEKLLKP
ncbi:MAG TPA: glycosyl hydrolase [Gammaproteobacteria bacterium]|nr:glycosyl hydrolase [Gammaproteobacteria bacterium]